MKTVLYGFLLLLAGFLAGFFAARRLAHNASTVERVEYVHEPAVTGSVHLPEPVCIEVPALLSLPVRTDTVYVDTAVYLREVVYTAAIIRDYELKRLYAVQLFDNQYGKLDVSLSTQYNRLDALSLRVYTGL